MSHCHHVCKICGKWFATAKAVHGHQRMHSGPQRIWGLKKPWVCSISTSIESETLYPLRREYKATSLLPLKKSSSFMIEIEEHEMNEAAMSLVMFSERASVVRYLPPGDIAMDLEKIRHCVESKQEFSEVSNTCSDVVAQALPSPLRSSKCQTKRESNFSYRIKICGKSFERSLGGHQTLHRSNRGQLARKKEEFEVGHSLSVLTSSGAKKGATGQPHSIYQGFSWTSHVVQPQLLGFVSSKQQSKKAKVVQSAYCEVCKVDCNGPSVFEQHKLGKKHLKNLEKLKPCLPLPSSTGSSSLAGPTVAVPLIGPQENPCKIKARKNRKTGAESTKNLESKRPKVVECGAANESIRVCRICNVVCNSDKVYNNHLADQKHAAKAAQAPVNA